MVDNKIINYSVINDILRRLKIPLQFEYNMINKKRSGNDNIQEDIYDLTSTGNFFQITRVLTRRFC